MNLEDALSRIRDLSEKRVEIDRQLTELVNLGPRPLTALDRKGAAGRPPKKRSQAGSTPVGAPKPCCGSVGKRHKSGCAQVGMPSKPFPIQAESRAATNQPMSQQEYDALREEMFDRDFSTLVYATQHQIRPREINAAIKSDDYGDYLASR